MDESGEGYTVSGRRWSDVHPEVMAYLKQHNARLDKLEEAANAQGDKRMEDFKLFTEKLGEVHEKVNKVALGMWALVATGLGALAIMLITKMADHTYGGK